MSMFFLHHTCTCMYLCQLTSKELKKDKILLTKKHINVSMDCPFVVAWASIIADHHFVQILKLGWPLLLLISVTYKFHY